MFGFSFGELLVISLVTLVAVGPQKLPGMLKTMGHWARKLRKMTMDVRQQTGIDELLRAEGIQISELRSLLRGYHAPAPAPVAPAPVAPPPVRSYEDPYGELEPDPTREYPPEGADAYGALPDDLLEPATSNDVAVAPGQPEPGADEAAVSIAEPAVSSGGAPEPTAADEAAVTIAEAAASGGGAPEPGIAGTAVSSGGAPEPSIADTAASGGGAPEPSIAERGVLPPPPPRPSAPPPAPSSRPALTVPRPAGTPPPPPRRSSGPPRPDAVPPAKPESSPLASSPAAPGTGNANGNG